MSTDETEEPERNKQAELAAIQYPVETVAQPQARAETMQLTYLRRFQPVKISIVFIIPGALLLVFSAINNSQVLAFIGLGLTFWGALFLFISPMKYVESSLLDSTALSTYATIDRITKDLKQKAKAYYVPPYPEEVYLPEHLKGLKDMVVFLPSEGSAAIPSIEEMAKGKFLLENPKGICISPPGIGLLIQFEKELKRDITKLELTDLCESLPQLILENLQLAKEIEMKLQEKNVYLMITGSAYAGLYGEENLKSVRLLGCPLVSAIACAIAKTTGKPVTIQKDKISPDNQTIEVWYHIMED